MLHAHFSTSAKQEPGTVLGSRPVVLPDEILDSLPASSPAASASRRDLKIFNRLLGTRRWVRSVLNRTCFAHDRILEVGAGDGVLGGAMQAAGWKWDGLDRLGRPRSWQGACRWIDSDIFEHIFEPEHRVIVASLFFHHFTDQQLREIGSRIRKHARVIIAADLWRSEFRVRIFRLLCRAIRAHPVSRHDGELSIRAGFRDDELPRYLGLGRQWRWQAFQSITGAYRLVAVKVS